jgi:hypothetical protein
VKRKKPRYDPKLLDELARCYARAAVDRLIEEQRGGELMKGPKSTPDDLVATAYHEAGHAVLQIALGIGCEGVTVVPDYGKGSAGASARGGAYGKMAESSGEKDDDVATLRLFAEDAFLLRHAIADLAGAEAVRRWKPRRKNWKAGSESDYRSASDRINAITRDAESVDLLHKYAYRRCTVLVEHYWSEISVIAAILLRQKLISGDKARKAFLKSLDARRGRILSW